MLILKVYTDISKLREHLYSIGTANEHYVTAFHDCLDYKRPYADVVLANGIKFQFRLLRTLSDAHEQIAGCRYPFVEYHSDDVPQDVKDFILSRLGDPKDYS